MTGRIRSPNSDQPPIKSYVVQVMKKVNSKWMIPEGYPKF